MSNSLTTNLVVNSDGSVDSAASRAAFDTALSAHISERETQETLIEEAVSQIFDQFKGASVGMPALASMTANKLNAVPANYKVLTERTLKHVRENADGKGRALYAIVRGKGGGTRRVSDQPKA
jgi:sulfur relay (sulfurtransferase) DsrF/TusC family protein